MSQTDRHAAILTLASQGQFKRLDVEDLEALAELAEESGCTLAELLLRGNFCDKPRSPCRGRSHPVGQSCTWR